MTATQASDVRFGRLERRGLLLGLSGAQLALVGSALIIVVAAGMAAGPAGLLFTVPLWGGALAMALLPVGGRPLVEVLPVVAPWAARRARGAHLVLARTTDSDDDLTIPGVRGRLRITVEPITGAAVIRATGARAAVTVVAQVRGPGFLLEDAATQDRRVTSWGRLLGSIGLAGVTGIQVLHCTRAGADVRTWWARQSGPAPAWASRVLDEVNQDATTTRLECLIAVSLRPRRGSDLEAVLASLAEAMAAAELGAAWLTPRQLRGRVRRAYDPIGTDRHGPDGSDGPAGPMGIAENWSHARSDSAFHATYWIAEWPRSATHPSFLRPLLLAAGADRAFSLIAQPLPTAKALREIRRARAEQLADASTRARIGRVEDEASRAAASELTRREEDLIAGHGDLRFVGLIAVSAPTLEELENSCASLESSAGQAGCELRRLVGQQVQAYAAAALPLARVLS
ncbi:SCO6880 family protein [Sporichthya polymorpha]|uniref:SCO6880 family protein n=1 Tax=Sporichthya polymorpha TaxID=35751 RepID=UPI0003A4E29E|nr:SCO6880 family protein [Sporichthya polymorpha]